MIAIEGQGFRIPAVGLGTWQLRGRACARIVEQAIKLGYRHIDTAEMYENEREVGEGVRASGVPREDIHVTTKIWPQHFSPPELARAARECAARLRLGEIDLLLLHWPSNVVPLSETIAALCKVKRDGIARQIGVSNFSPDLVVQATELSDEPLVCNQIEAHPFLDQEDTIAACQARDMVVVAYSPIAKGGVKGNETLSRIGKAHGKTAAQASLRYLVQRGLAVIPRTSRVERLSENFAIDDFELAPDEMTAITALARPDGSVT
jgi:2,5-diketo-D-gluconate reductase B